MDADGQRTGIGRRIRLEWGTEFGLELDINISTDGWSIHDWDGLEVEALVEDSIHSLPHAIRGAVEASKIPRSVMSAKPPPKTCASERIIWVAGGGPHGFVVMVALPGRVAITFGTFDQGVDVWARLPTIQAEELCEAIEQLFQEYMHRFGGAIDQAS